MSVVGPVRWVVRTDIFVIEATAAFCSPAANASSDRNRTGGGSDATVVPNGPNPPKCPTTATTARIRATTNRGLTHRSGAPARARACVSTTAAAAPTTKQTNTIAYSAAIPRCRTSSPARVTVPVTWVTNCSHARNANPFTNPAAPARRSQLGMCRAA